MTRVMWSIAFMIGLIMELGGCVGPEKTKPREVISKGPAQFLVTSNADDSILFGKAQKYFESRNYDATIRIVRHLLFEDPTSWKKNILLCKSLVEKAALLKVQKDKTYVKLLKETYRRAKWLRKMNKLHPEPYYIAAKVCLIKDTENSLDKGMSLIKKALSVSPNNPVYLNLLQEIRIQKKQYRKSKPHLNNEL